MSQRKKKPTLREEISSTETIKSRHSAIRPAHDFDPPFTILGISEAIEIGDGPVGVILCFGHAFCFLSYYSPPSNAPLFFTLRKATFHRTARARWTVVGNWQLYKTKTVKKQRTHTHRDYGGKWKAQCAISVVLKTETHQRSEKIKWKNSFSCGRNWAKINSLLFPVEPRLVPVIHYRPSGRPSSRAFAGQGGKTVKTVRFNALKQLAATNAFVGG